MKLSLISAAVLLGICFCVPVPAQEYTDEELEKLKAEWTHEAVAKYPLHRIGDTVTVSYRVFGGTLDEVTGIFYRQDAKSIWIGSKQISKKALPDEELVPFDPGLVEQRRKNYVMQRVKTYNRAKEAGERKRKKGEKKESDRNADGEMVLTESRSTVKHSEKDLVTKSGKVFKNYVITRREGSFVIVNHEAGGAKIRISDLPDEVARPFVKPIVDKEIAALKNQKDFDRQLDKLGKLKVRYPAVGDMIDQEIALVREEEAFEKKFSAALFADTERKRIDKLDDLLEEYKDVLWAKERLEREVARQNIHLQLNGIWLLPFVSEKERDLWRDIDKTYRETEHDLEKTE